MLKNNTTMRIAYAKGISELPPLVSTTAVLDGHIAIHNTYAEVFEHGSLSRTIMVLITNKVKVTNMENMMIQKIMKIMTGENRDDSMFYSSVNLMSNCISLSEDNGSPTQLIDGKDFKSYSTDNELVRGMKNNDVNQILLSMKIMIVLITKIMNRLP